MARRTSRSPQSVERLSAVIQRRAPVEGVTVGGELGSHSVFAPAAATNPAAAALAALLELRWRASGSRFSELRDEVAPFVMGQHAIDENEGTRAELAGKLQTQLEKLAAQIALLGDPPDTGVDEADELHRWDAVLIEQLKQTGKAGRKQAKQFAADSLRRTRELRSGDAALAYVGFAPSAAAMWRVWFNTPLPDSYEGARPGENDAASKRCLYEYALARALWLDKVKPQIDRTSRLEPVRLATDLANTFTLARLCGGDRQDGYIVVAPPRGIALMLPLDDSLRVEQRDRGFVSLRQVLAGRPLRTYLATLLIYQDCGMPQDGVFTFDGPNAILDVIGAAKNTNKKRSDVYGWYRAKDRDLVKSDLELFTRIRVHAVGEAEMTAGDALLDEMKERANGRTMAYMHARLIARELRGRYIRIPRKVCQLDADEVSIAIGIANFARTKMLTHLRDNEPICAPLRHLLSVAGVDSDAGVRKHGRAFWQRMVDSLIEIADKGKLGALVVDRRFDGPDAVMTLNVEASLRESYAPLLSAAHARAREQRSARIADQRRPTRPTKR